MQTEKRMPNMALFLTTWDSFPLKDAIEIDRAGTPRKDGKDYLSTDADTLKQGPSVPAATELSNEEDVFHFLISPSLFSLWHVECDWDC